ncbi:MAG TPA: hypothetical protein VJM46_01405 [Candidatus Saccharimonadales bacterium]|nr:hypothetical protein [Candidatus Saccharimonadales bacterium]
MPNNQAPRRTVLGGILVLAVLAWNVVGLWQTVVHARNGEAPKAVDAPAIATFGVVLLVAVVTVLAYVVVVKNAPSTWRWCYTVLVGFMMTFAVVMSLMNFEDMMSPDVPNQGTVLTAAINVGMVAGPLVAFYLRRPPKSSKL